MMAKSWNLRDDGVCSFFLAVKEWECITDVLNRWKPSVIESRGEL